MSRTANINVVRSFAYDEDACGRAFELLLKKSRTKRKAAGHDGGENAGKEDHDDSGTISIPRSW